MSSSIESILKEYLENQNIKNPKGIIYNPSYEELFQEEMKPDLEGYEKAILTNMDTIAVDTGVFTGRSPKDKYIVKDQITEHTLWWATEGKNDNKAIDQNTWLHLKDLVAKELSNKKLFIIDAMCGASSGSSLKVRFITEVAWQAHFVKNMFIPMTKEDELREIDFLVINGAKAINKEYKKYNLNSENFIAFNFSEKIQLIGGTWYGGEMKKGLFAVMNYLLPQKNIASMHCSANVSKNGDVNLFFGLSGTGKTTLSTTSKQALIGDDEHGWDSEGIFNFEGGCYAKAIRLKKEKEPEIYNAIKRNALLENVVIRNGSEVDFNDSSKTENTRVSYPINHIENIVKPISKAGHAKNIIFLSADAFGVLPPISILNDKQIEYYFLSGFTSKVAGTERGITEPTPTFSSCFGAAFLTLHPTKYSKILLEKVKEHNSKVYLVNTGWNGKNERISLENTRTIVNSIFSNEINQVETTILPIFNLEIPLSLSGVSREVLDPRSSYDSANLWEERAKHLAKLFINNFDSFNGNKEIENIKKFGPLV